MTEMSERPAEQIVDARVRGDMSCADLAMGAFDALAATSSYVLVSDHDPRGIRYMLQAERPGASSWDELESGPDVWRARITRSA